MKCGYVALLGKPNAGKSTLLNACIGQKLAGVSTKPQTTRNKILGIDNIDSCQVIYLDTPGIHKSHQSIRINQIMNQAAWAVLDEADYVLYLVDCKAGITEEDRVFIRDILVRSKVSVEIILTKIDSVKKHIVEDALYNTTIELREIEKQAVLKLSDQLSEKQAKKKTPDETNGTQNTEKNKHSEGKIETSDSLAAKPITRLVSTTPSMISAKRPEEVKELRKHLAGNLPEGPFLYGPDELTDKSQKFVASEMIREQIFRQLGDEIPYGISVVTDSIEATDKLTTIDATIVVEREAHKPIVLGKKGSRIKKLGISSRETLEKHFETQVMLNLFVRVQTNWINNDKLISELQAIIEED